MIVRIKPEYLELFHKAGKNKKRVKELEFMIQDGVFGVEPYNSYTFNHPHNISDLFIINPTKIVGRIKSIDWDKGYIDISFLRAHIGLRKYNLIAVPVISTHYYSGSIQDPTYKLNKILLEVLEE